VYNGYTLGDRTLMRIPPKRCRIVTHRRTTTKAMLIKIMQELEPGLKAVDGARAYDRVTAAINGWLMANTRSLPKGLHARLLLANCMSVNLCWLRGKAGRWADYPTWWMTLMDRKYSPGPRRYIHRQRCAEYNRWLAGPDSRETSPKQGDGQG
jgi:hypothetical protein